MAANGFSNFENFGNYILLKKLATGGMAEVFLARPNTSRGNGRVQVIKRILPLAANDADFIKMFQTEIQVCLGFNHPHTVQIHDFGEYGGRPYISMEYIEGKNLKDIICKFTEQGESMPIPMALSLLSQAASGLTYAHNFVNKVTGEEVRAIHRDVSPHNLIVSYDGNLKVIDFGIAKAATSIQDATRAGTIKGKYAYLSPEQIHGEPLDARVDIFALGIVAWELLTLRRPFYRAGDSELTILNTISNCDHTVKAPSYYNGAIPPELDQLILKALRRNPDERFSSADQFQAAIRQVMQTHYPHYSYSENGKMMQTMFAKEIVQERNEIRMLNMNVQLSLSNSTFEEATVISAPLPTPGLIAPLPSAGSAATPSGSVEVAGTGAAGVATVVVSNVTGSYAPAPAQIVAGSDVDLRLRGIEKLMKEKASARHYFMFGFYLISLIVIKVDASYNLFEFLIPQSHIAASAQRAASARAATAERSQVAVPVPSAPAAAAMAPVRAAARAVTNSTSYPVAYPAQRPARGVPVTAPAVVRAPAATAQQNRAPQSQQAQYYRAKAAEAARKLPARRTVVTQEFAE